MPYSPDSYSSMPTRAPPPPPPSSSTSIPRYYGRTEQPEPTAARRELRPAANPFDDAASYRTPLSINGIEPVPQRAPPPPPESIPEAESSVSDGNMTVATVRSDKHTGMQTVSAAVEVFNSIRAQTIAEEDPAQMIKRMEKVADRSFRRTYVMGSPAREVHENAPVVKVGIAFLPGCDRPAVTQIEQLNMMPNRQPDQQNAVWRVNTAGNLLTEFEVASDFSVITSDKTPDILAKVRDRNNRKSMFGAPSTPDSMAVVPHRREMAAVNIDSEEVKVVHDLRHHAGEFDLEATLIEVCRPFTQITSLC
jgi:hypothetical protein